MPPLTPNEISAYKAQQIPEEVIEVWNLIIAKHFTGASSQFTRVEVVKAIADKMNVDTRTVYDNGWLYIRELYTDAGWEIKLDIPGYNETYEAFYVFCRKS